MDEKEEVKQAIKDLREGLDFLNWKVDRCGQNFTPYIDLVEVQAIRVVQLVKVLQDALGVDERVSGSLRSRMM